MYYSSRDELERIARAGVAELEPNVHRVLSSFWLEIDPNDTAFTPWIMKDGFWEAWLSVAICRELHELPDRGIFLDVGANVGYYSLLGNAAGVYTHAFEPIPDVYDMLTRSVDINKARQCIPHNVAISDYIGRTKIQVEKSHTGGSFLTPDGNVNVEVVTLDCFDFKSKDVVLKVDVEGFERNVWNGASDLRENARTTWFVEWVPDRDRKSAREWLEEVVETHEIFWVSYRGNLKETTLEQCMTMEFETLCFKNKTKENA